MQEDVQSGNLVFPGHGGVKQKKELMGHKTLAMTERYAHLIPDHKKEAVKGLADRFSELRGNKEAKVVQLAKVKKNG